MLRFFGLKTHRLGLTLALLVSTVGCDQLTKAIARETLTSRPMSFFVTDSRHLKHDLSVGAVLLVQIESASGLGEGKDL